MGYCDECTLRGVFSEHTRNQRAAREGVVHTTTLQTYSPGDIGVRVSISHSLLTTDKSHHPASLVKLGGPGGGQKLKAGLL